MAPHKEKKYSIETCVRGFAAMRRSLSSGSTQTRTSKSKGFTLIELLVVIAIIGLLASIILASLNSARAKGRDAARVSDLKEVQLSLELYYDANNGYPAADSGNAIPAVLVTDNDLSAMPHDPNCNSSGTCSSGTTDYQYYAADSSGNTCASGTTDCPAYLLVGNLEAGAQSGTVTTKPTGSAYSSVTTCADGSSAPYPYCLTN